MLYVSSPSRLRLRAENFRGEKGYIYAVDIPLAGENIVTIIGGLPTVMVITNARVKQGNVNVETPTYDIVSGCGAYLGGGKWLYGRILADNSWKLYLWDGATLTDLSSGISSTPYTIAFYNGLAYIGQKDGYFHKYDPNANTFTGINLGLTTGDHISSICGDDLFIYIGTVTGKLKRYDPATGTVDDLTTNINAAKINQLIHNPYNNTIIAILNDGLVVKDSSNRGIVWTPRTANLPLNFPPITSATVEPSTGRITMGNSQGRLIEVSPNWLHCTPLTDNFILPQESVKCLLVTPARLYVDTWISKTSLPPTDGRAHSSTCLIKGKLYYFGGESGGTPTANTYEYTPQTDTWAEKASMPTARWGLIVVAYNYKAYVFGGQTSTGLTNVLEVFEPFVFSPVWNSGVIATGTALDTARNIIIDGNYLYAVSSTSQRLVVYDISNPSSPVQKALVSLGRGAVDIRKKGNYLLISTLGATDGGVDIYDVSNPASPQYVTRVNLGGHTHGMFLLGDYLYVCMHYNDTFVIIDVSNPASPVVKGSITSSTYLNGCHDVWVEAGYAYVTSYLAGTGQYGFTVIDVSNPSSPTIVGYTGENHKNSGIFKVGNYCYVASHSPDTGMRVYDVSNPASPTFIGQFYTEIANLGYWMDDYDSTTLAAVAPADDNLYLIDISSPASPKIITKISAVERPANVAVSGDYFYISTTDSSYNWRIRSFTRTTQWTTKTSMPYSLQGLMAIYLPYDGKIHLFGGYDGSTYTNLHFTYDPATDTYDTTTPAAMPHGRNWATCALINNLIYIIGGYKHNYNDRYDPATNTWTTLAPLPISSLYGAARENPVINGIIYVTHGQDPPSPTYYATVYAYDPSTNTWTQKTTGMNPRDGVACGVTNEILLVIGGRYGSTAYRYSEAYFP
jgi:hypothetical protein